VLGPARQFAPTTNDAVGSVQLTASTLGAVIGVGVGVGVGAGITTSIGTGVGVGSSSQLAAAPLPGAAHPPITMWIGRELLTLPEESVALT
jgi:hypothetical protein